MYLMFGHHHFLIWGRPDRLNLPKMRSFRFLVGRHFNTLEESRDKWDKDRGPRVPRFPRRNVALAAWRVGFRYGPGGEVQAAPTAQQLAAPVQAPEFEPAVPSAAARTPQAGRDASLLAPPAQAAAPAGHPHPARRSVPADPQVASGARRAAKVRSSDPPRTLKGYPVASTRTFLRFVRFPQSFS